MAAALDDSIPAWVLQDARPYGPFPVHLVGQDHAVLRVPNDRRLWVDAQRVHSFRFDRKEVFPLSLLTQDPEEAKAWRERNEPRVGDLVSVKCKKWGPVAKGEPKDVTVEGVVGKVLEHQLQLFSQPDQDSLDGVRWLLRHDGTGLGRHVSKDACIVLVRGEENFSIEKSAAL